MCLAVFSWCWVEGRRGVRVLLTGEQDRYRRLLSEVIDPDRLVIDIVKLTEAQLRDRERAVRAQAEDLAADEIF